VSHRAVSSEEPSNRNVLFNQPYSAVAASIKRYTLHQPHWRVY